MNEKPVAIFIMNSSLGGAEKRFIRIASELSEKRKDILLIVSPELYEASLLDKEIKEKINFLFNQGQLIKLTKKKVKNKYKRILSRFINLYIIIKKYNIQILHCSLGALKYAYIKKITGVKIIAEITSPDIARQLTEPKKYKKMVPYFDKIIAVSEGVKNRTIESLKKIGYQNSIKDIHCFSIPFFLPMSEVDEFSTEEKENIIVFASRFIERKNPLLFAQAAKKFLKENSAWKIIMLGEGPLEEKVKLELDDFINQKRAIVEHSNNVYSYLKKSKIFVSLIYPDNYPSQSILEAMFMKNAIVATDVGNTKKLVTLRNGYLVHEYEIDNVYQVLNQATKDENKIKEKGKESASIVNNNFHKDNYLKELQKVYRSL